MKVNAVAHAAELTGLDLKPWTTVIVDVIRASSTIAQAVANGCKRIIPVASIDEALEAKAAAGGGKELLLCGERQALKIEGFDLGNSPREYLPELVRGKTLILTTTNGTRAIVASKTAKEITIGSFLNLDALVSYLVAQQTDVLVVPVGRDEQPVLDDVVCGGLYVQRLMEAGGTGLNGAAHLARMTYMGYQDRLLQGMLDSPSGQNLVRQGLADDLPYCLQIGRLSVVPRVVDGQIWGI